MQAKECSDCIHSRVTVSDVEEEGPILKCHRFPPVMMVINSQVVQGYPDADQYCGEWKTNTPRKKS